MMEDIDYVMIGIWIVLLAILFYKDIWYRVRHNIKHNEYVIIGVSRENKISILLWIMICILYIFGDREIAQRVVWIGLSIFWIYQSSRRDIIFEQGIGEKGLFGDILCKIKWEQVESYRRTYQDEIVIEYIRQNPLTLREKNKKYSMYINEKKISLFYEEIQKYIKEKEIS